MLNSCARRLAFLLLFRHAAHFPVHRIGHKPVALRLAHRPARQHTTQAPAIGIDPPPRRPGVPADDSEVARLLAESLVGRGPEAGFGLVALLARVPLDAGPVALDEVELGVVLGKEGAVVAPRKDELLDGVLLCLEVRLLRQEELEAARRVARLQIKHAAGIEIIP